MRTRTKVIVASIIYICIGTLQANAQTAPVAPAAQFGNDGAALGLTEKRLMKDLVDTNIPEFVAYVDKACGVKLKVEVDWNSFGKDEAGLRAFNMNALEHVSGALDEVCKDDLGKTAIKKTLSTYQIKNVKPEEKKVKLENTVLSLDAGFGSEWSAGAVSQADIKELIESKL